MHLVWRFYLIASWTTLTHIRGPLCLCVFVFVCMCVCVGGGGRGASVTAVSPCLCCCRPFAAIGPHLKSQTPPSGAPPAPPRRWPDPRGRRSSPPSSAVGRAGWSPGCKRGRRASVGSEWDPGRLSWEVKTWTLGCFWQDGRRHGMRVLWVYERTSRTFIPVSVSHSQSKYARVWAFDWVMTPRRRRISCK